MSCLPSSAEELWKKHVPPNHGLHSLPGSAEANFVPTGACCTRWLRLSAQLARAPVPGEQKPAQGSSESAHRGA
jgi:hypothetical protein